MVESQAKIQLLGSVLGHHDAASRQHYTLLAIDRTEPKKKIRFAKQKIRFDFFGSTPTRPGRNLTRTFPKTEPKFGLQNLPINGFTPICTEWFHMVSHRFAMPATVPVGQKRRNQCKQE